ncbi:MAG: redoxin domain-containing protein [Chloroherpetonaceae bacterium]|nr:redoxin domain-containing protein [Chloroherpetonaceae bacterium]
MKKRTALLQTLSIGILLCSISSGAHESKAQNRAVRVKDLHGTTRSIPDTTSKATVLIFITTDCPIANTYAPEIQRIHAQCSRENIALYVVYADPSISLQQVRRHVRDYGYRCPAIRDAKHTLVRMVNATMTPEAAVLLPDGKLIYRGRIDDRYLDYGKKRTQPTRHDLRDVLHAVLQGKANRTLVTTRAVGCFIPR